MQNIRTVDNPVVAMSILFDKFVYRLAKIFYRIQPYKPADNHLEVIRTLEEKLSIKAMEVREAQNLIDVMADTSPAMLWAKDINDNFTYANDEIRHKLLGTEGESPIGKDGVYFAQKHIAKGRDYNFGVQCKSSDQVVREKGRNCVFLEEGNAYNDIEKKSYYLALIVHKAPLWYLDCKNKLKGTIGIGVDVTDQVLEHRQLVEYYKSKDWVNFERLLDSHVNKHYFGQTPSSRLIKVL